MKRFHEKTALVTGAASGIGLATAKRLAREGAHVLACDVNAAGLSEQVSQLASEGLHVQARVLDVADSAACGAAVEAAVAAFGRIDVLCNVAGMGLFKRFGDVSSADWERLIAVNLTSVFVLSQAAMPHLISSKGCIVNVASAAGLVGLPYSSVYCATKGGVALLTKSLAVEFARQGVRVNAVCPGHVNTPLTKGFSAPDGADMELMGRMFPITPFGGEPQDIAASIAYLASDEARYVTGATFAIDGGQTAI